MMSDEKKMDFVHKQTKLALQHIQHFDSGGTVLGNPSMVGNQNSVNPSSQGVLGSIGNFLGTNNNFQASGANLQQGTNANQLNQAYGQAQNAQANTQGALGNANQLQANLAGGVLQGAGTQNNLTQQLQAQALGGGPNPAQAALNENTGRNIEQQAALQASQRGAGANAGLIAQNAARQGAATQQQAIGQGAALQAQQQLAAQNQLQNLANSQIGQGTQATQLQNQVNQGAQNLAQGEQNILQNANTGFNNAAVSQQQNINNVNAEVAKGNQNSNSNLLTGIAQGVGSIGAGFGKLLGFAHGGQVHPDMPDHLKLMHQHYYAGGAAWQDYGQDYAQVPSQINPGASPQFSPNTGKSLAEGIREGVANPLFGQKESSSGTAPGTQPTGAGGGYGLGGQGMSDSLGGSSTPALTEPALGSSAGLGAASAAPSLGVAALLSRGGKVMKDGGKVPGKPKVNHDAYKNDTVSAKLSPGEVVIPISVLNDKSKLGQMARFVAANIERKKSGRKL